MDDFLTPVSTTYTRTSEAARLSEAAPAPSSKRTGISSPEDALEALKAQPDYDTLVRALRYLSQPGASASAFSIHTPGPLSAQITQTLVTEIAPNYWPLLREGSLPGQEAPQPRRQDATDLDLFLGCLRSLAGLNTVLLRLRAFVLEIKAGGGAGPRRPDLVLNTNLVLELLCAVLQGESTVQSIWRRATSRSDDASKQRQVSTELVSSLARGKVVALAAEAQALSGEPRSSSYWVADGQEYSRWIATSIASWVQGGTSDVELKVCGELLMRAQSLGYPGKSAVSVRVRGGWHLIGL
jgi:telomere length regulation protein